MSTTLLIALALPFLLMPFLPGLGGRLGARAGWFALLAPVVCTALLFALARDLPAGGREIVEWSWIPSFGLNLTFVVDGLSLFFGLVVAGMGTLIVFYARQYLDDHYEHHGRFYAYLLLFMGAMLGTVFAGNVLLLFVFWELTGLASFLLIGFLHEKAESRDGARMALLVTVGTGLPMLAGIVLLGHLAGTYELAALLDGALRGADPALVNTAFVLIAVGAFGKSAQFPFHFWLPNAMAAPTPVSAYLHSATMVKLGVFLVARIFPVFAGTDLWMTLLVPVCFGTMLLGAVLALLSHDLKAILAYSTVSQLGFLMGYYGLSAPAGSLHDLLHVANHVFYKGCLFMVAGIVDHAAGTRDVRLLGRLGRRLPLLCLIAVAAGAAMAGLPGTLGFISKEYALKETFALWAQGDLLHRIPAAVLVAASAIQVAFVLRLVWGVFGGRAPVRESDTKAHTEGHEFHAPGFALQLPPLLLATATVTAGLLPGWFGGVLGHLRTPGLHAGGGYTYSLWHGVTPELLTSAGIVATGIVLFLVLQRAGWRVAIPGWVAFDRAFEAAVKWLPLGAKQLSSALRTDRQFDFLAIAFGFTVLLVGGYGWTQREALWPGLPGADAFDPLRTFVVVLIALAVAMVIIMRRWTAQLIAVSIIGFLITFYYVLFRAPDLAMTQILVESATLLLVLLLLARFPRSAELSEIGRSFSLGRQVMNVVLATGIGLITMLAALMAMQHKHRAPLGEYYLENTVPLAHGTNAVNTILVDFRGFDTLLEVTVLMVACLGALGLLMRYRRTAEEYAAGEMGPAGYGLGRERLDAEKKKP